MLDVKIERFRIKTFLMGALLCAVFLACGGVPAPSAAKSQPAAPVDELDAVIRETSDYLNGKVPGGSKAVFLNIRSDYPDLSEYILSVLSENAVNDGVFSVVDRQQLDLIRAELNFQMSGEVSDESAQNIGQILGAQSIVSGAVSKIGSLYRVQVKAIEVQSAGVQGQWSRNIPNGATIAVLTERYAPAFATSGITVGGAVSARGGSSGAAAQAQVPASPVYTIGGIGPGGGLIFYDKFSTGGGWRYLEAAPRETEQELAWGRFSNFDGTTTAIGGGRRNTELVVQAEKNLVTAARFCADLEYGGYDDWFLPSKDELDLIYKNLKVKGLGSFSGDLYWSSSYSGGWDSGPWRQSFGDGVQRFDSVWTGSGGSNTYRVRAVRQF
jgi:hypothetical protein